jgi:hypothetical protein
MKNLPCLSRLPHPCGLPHARVGLGLQPLNKASRNLCLIARPQIPPSRNAQPL